MTILQLPRTFARPVLNMEHIWALSERDYTVYKKRPLPLDLS